MNTLEIKNISKRFGGVHALTDISFTVGNNEICSVVGENGAGKSTLMNIISGAITPDSGDICIDGKKIEIYEPLQAQKYGIGIVHQELTLVKDLSVYENMFLGRLITNKYGICNHKNMRILCKKALDEVGLKDVTPEMKARDLSTAKQQLVEIARVLLADPKIIIMDEPTSSLSDEDSERLLELLMNIRKKGKIILYISHRLVEVKKISDTIVVLRDGKFIGKCDAAGLSNDEIVKMMVGENINEVVRVKKYDYTKSQPILEVKDLSVPPKVKNVTFTLNKGEVLGIAGLVGSGRSELLRGIYGVDKTTSGQIFLNGKKVKRLSPWVAISSETNIGFVSENRKKEGLVFGKSIRENIAMSFRQHGYSGQLIRSKEESNIADSFKARLGIKSQTVHEKVENLSGGNQQKVILARCLAINPKILFLDEPTRGIDVGAKSEIHKLISQLADNGISILVVSSELEELSLLCDRVLVISDGKLVHELESDKISESEMLKYAIPS